MAGPRPRAAGGVLTSPEAAFPRLAAALRASTWLSAPLLGEVFSRWVGHGTAEQVARQRVAACQRRSSLAHEVLAGLDVQGDPGSPHGLICKSAGQRVRHPPEVTT